MYVDSCQVEQVRFAGVAAMVSGSSPCPDVCRGACDAGISLRSDFAGSLTVLSVLAAVGRVAASYPWFIGADLLLACQLLVATWIIVVGLRLLQEQTSGGIRWSAER